MVAFVAILFSGIYGDGWVYAGVGGRGPRVQCACDYRSVGVGAGMKEVCSGVDGSMWVGKVVGGALNEVFDSG